jgi:hypothetical protein
LCPQSRAEWRELMTGRAVFTEAYAVIKRPELFR